MAETEQITVAEISEGAGGAGEPETPVTLPVVELLTGRGFVTGKSGSGKSNTASVVAEKLLDNGFGLLVVDIDGEYYGLKEEYEILHAGADEECDVQVTADHAERLATLALEENVPIILDISSFFDESEAREVLTAVARHLFAKAKKQKQPFLLLVEEVHEYIPEGGSVGECGKMLIKIGKRGRKHGLGIVGISQRPADVKKDFITQCDWLVWHRLTWDNDTNVVKRVLDAEYATAVEELGDGEAFLVSDWAESVQRVQFQRKRTFDAGATPGLEDFERPELKSVSDDLVSELESIGGEDGDDRIAELRVELDEKNSRIAELERELQDARDLSRMADQFVEALIEEVGGANPGRTEQERLRRRHNGHQTRDGVDGASADAAGTGETSGDDDGTANGTTPGEKTDEVAAATAAATAAADGDGAADASDGGGEGAEPRNGSEAGPESGSEFSAEEILGRLRTVVDAPGGVDRETGEGIDDSPGGDSDPDSGPGAGPSDTEAAGQVAGTTGNAIDGSLAVAADAVGAGGPEATPIGEIVESGASVASVAGDDPLAVRELTAVVGGLGTRTRRMLAFYADDGPATPLAAHEAAGGDGDRTSAYAHNRQLRTRGLIEHVGRGRYDARLRTKLGDAFDDGTAAEYADLVLERALDGDR